MATGVEAGLDRKDSWITSYRCHCTMLARGGSVKAILAELFGKSGGVVNGNDDTNFNIIQYSSNSLNSVDNVESLRQRHPYQVYPCSNFSTLSTLLSELLLY